MNILVPRKLRRRLRHYAIDADRAAREIAIDAIVAYLDNHEDDPPMTEHDRPDTPPSREPAGFIRRLMPRLPKLTAPPRLRLRLPPKHSPAVYAAVALLALVLLVLFTPRVPDDGPELAAELLELAEAEAPVPTPVSADLPPPATEIIEPDSPDVLASRVDVDAPERASETPEPDRRSDEATPDSPETPDADPRQASPTPPPWEALDDSFLLDPAAVARFTTLPRPYAWPLPWAQSRVICHTNTDAPHIHMLQSPDGRLYHWGEAARYVRQINTAHGIASTEVATVSPTAFLEPLRAAGQRLCVTRDAEGTGAASAEAADQVRTPVYSPANALPFDLPAPPPAGRTASPVRP